jgi:hypothetical protein
MVDAARIRRPPGGGHFLYGLTHAQTLVVVIGIVVVVAILVYQNKRR